VLHQFVAGEGDAWRLALNALGQYFERALGVVGGAQRGGARAGRLLDLAFRRRPPGSRS
jgi:hypothetical protein